MKKIFAIVLCSLFIFSACNSTNDTENSVSSESNTKNTSAPSAVTVENPDFRTVKWGMTKDEVIACEGSPDKENFIGEKGGSSYRIGYNNISVVDYATDLYYYFEDDKLYSAEYEFTCNGKTDLQIHNMYITIRDEYIGKYGNPIDSTAVISNLDYYDKIGTHIFDSDFNFGGVASYSNEWSGANNAQIRMNLSYLDEDTIYFDIEYYAIDSNI